MINKVPGKLNSKLDEHFDMPAMLRLGAWVSVLFLPWWWRCSQLSANMVRDMPM